MLPVLLVPSDLALTSLIPAASSTVRTDEPAITPVPLAAGVAFDNMVDEYPDSKFREEAMMYALRSKAELAINFSRLESKDLRLQEARTQYRQLMKYYPSTSFKSEADKILKNIENEIEKTKVALEAFEKAKAAAQANK